MAIRGLKSKANFVFFSFLGRPCTVVVCFALTLLPRSVLSDSASLNGLTGKPLVDAVKSVVADRRESLSNISFDSEVTIQQLKWSEVAGFGTPTNNGVSLAARIWRDGNSYKVSSRMLEGTGGVLLLSTATERISGEENWLSAKGVRRSFTTQTASGQVDAAISLTPATTVRSDIASFYLSEAPDSGGFVFWRRFLSSVDNASRVSVNGSQLSVVAPLMDGTATGIHEVDIDLEHGFCPIREVVEWKFSSATPEGWSRRSASCQELVEHDGVWVPTTFEASTCSNIYDDGVCVREISKVSNLSLGSVGSDDLLVSFPPFTSVVDEIEGVQYRLDAEGHPLEKRKLLTREELAGKGQALVASGGSNGFRWFLLFNSVAIAIAGFYLWRSRRMSNND